MLDQSTVAPDESPHPEREALGEGIDVDDPRAELVLGPIRTRPPLSWLGPWLRSS